MKFLTIFALVLAGLGLTRASAASPAVRFSVPAGILRADELVPIDVTIDSGGAVMNAVELTGKFDPAAIEVDHIQAEQSAFTLWPETPSWDNARGTFHLVTGRPGGLVSVGARIATVYFRPHRVGAAEISLDQTVSNMLLNDGVGTKVAIPAATSTLTIHDALYSGIALTSPTQPSPDDWSQNTTITITWAPDDGAAYSYQLSTDPTAQPDDTPESVVGSITYHDLTDGRYYFTIKERIGTGPWSEVTQRRFLIDQTPPTAFAVNHPAAAAVHGANILTWVASDDTSGIRNATLVVNGKAYGEVTSPLRLRSEWRGKTLVITVHDQAGNATSAQWLWPGHTSWWTVVSGLVGAFILVIAGWWLWARRRHS